MNILFLCRLFNPHIGGVEKHVLFLSKEVKGHNQVTVLTEKDESSLKVNDTIDEINIIRIPINDKGDKYKKWIIWKWIINNLKFLDSFDVIHIHDVVFWLYPYKLLHPFKRIYCTFHGWEGVYPIPLKNIIQKKVDSLIVHKKICIGNFIEKWYRIKSDAITYGATKISHHLNKKSANTLLFVGRLDSDTGIEDCIKLYDKNKNTNKLKLEVIGDGPLRKILPSEAVCHGFVTNPESYISKAKYVYTNGYLGILESLALGKPVICSYNNPVKADYINFHPMRKYLNISKLPTSPKVDRRAIEWARNQTWSELANIYYKLWGYHQV